MRWIVRTRRRVSLGFWLRARAARAGLARMLDAADLCVLAGTGLCAWALYLIWMPLAPLAVGLLLLGLGFLGSRGPRAG